MSFGRKIISVITLAFAMITLTTFSAAQDTGADQTQKQRKFERKGNVVLGAECAAVVRENSAYAVFTVLI